MKEIPMGHLQIIADVLVESNSTDLLVEISRRDFQLAQILDVLIVESQEKLNGF